MSYGIGSVGHGIESLDQCKAPKTTSAIEQRLSQLEDCAKQIQAIADVLTRRLAPVLVPDMKNETTGASAPKPVSAPMVERLEQISRHLDASANSINSMIDRVAL